MTPKNAKDKKSKNMATNKNSVEKKSYTEEEKVRIAILGERSKKEPVKVKRAKDSSSEKPTLEIEGIEGGDVLLLATKLMETFGTSDQGLQIFLLNQMVQTFKWYTSAEVFDEEKLEQFCNNGLAILTGIEPRDEIEGMLAVQMVGVHNIAMETMARAILSEQTFDGKQVNINQAAKMLRTFTTQMEALKKYRTGGQQKVTVEHVHVNKGGQAIVGNVNQGGGGEFEKK